MPTAARSIEDSATLTAAQGLCAKILIADDAPECQRYISWALTKAGAMVDVAADGAAALKLAVAASEVDKPYDLILSDIEMPHVDGFELARGLRHSNIRTPIAALTAREDDPSAYLAAGFNGIITKPFRPAELVATCRGLILAREGSIPK